MSASNNKITRRSTIGALIGSTAMVATTSARAFTAPTGLAEPSAEAAFKAAFNAAADQPGQAAAARMAFLHPDALVVDHDVPFPLGRAAYEDHLRFRMDNLQQIETLFHALESRGHGDTAIVSAYFIERSKPKGSGFRLRAGFCTAVCTRVDSRWRALSLHMSPLSAQITDASPG
ncbi:MAG: nuclear transport factor 2 family protein [Sphingomonadaceae bacterium]|nr:nuclear transport factor 2 family protein [Sphingomonadaceae bacterium]